MIAAQVEESPDRPLVTEDEPIYDDFAPLIDQRSDDFDEDLLGEVPELEDEPVEARSEARHDQTEFESVTTKRAEIRGSTKKTIKVSKYGIEYPSLPPAVVKRLAQNFAKASGAKGKITPDAMKSIMQASDWFFEQLGEDLQAYSKHAGRKTIDESDVLTLMKRYGTIYYWVSREVLYMADISQTTSDQPKYYTIRSRATPPP
jgi:histone H3/H4